MKLAKLSNGELVNASERAPDQAICPYCNGSVFLRKRTKMGGDRFTYYWRHTNGKNTNCPARWKLS